jgi:hypothetical protein
MSKESSVIDVASTFLSLNSKYNSIYQTSVLSKTDSYLLFKDSINDELKDNYDKLSSVTKLFLRNLRIMGMPELISATHEKYKDSALISGRSQLVGTLEEKSPYDFVYKLRVTA